MKTNLKILTIAAVFIISSCEVYSAYTDTMTSKDLQSYASDVFSGHVIMPMLVTEFAMDLDAYMSLPEEDKINDFRFYGNIRKVEENYYIIDDGVTSCSVRTGGTSIWEDGAKWIFLSFSTESYMITHGKIYCNVSSEIVLESHSVPEEDGALRLFSMMYGDDTVGLELVGETENGRYMWNIGSSGRLYDTEGYWAEYMTGSDGISVTNRFNENLGEQGDFEYICSGEFIVNMYRNEEPLDWCRAIFSPGYDTVFKTSR